MCVVSQIPKPTSFPTIIIHFPTRRSLNYDRFAYIDDHEGHNVMIQAHGDSWCDENEGGPACLLKTLPEGYGHHIFDYQGITMDIDLNDVRSEHSSPQHFYIQTAVKWTQEEKQPATFLQFQNPTSGSSIPSTYRFKRRRGCAHYFNYTHENLGSGKLFPSTAILHGHQSQLDSWWLLKGDGVYKALEAFRHKKGYNIPMTVEKTPDEILRLKEGVIEAVKGADGVAELICEVEKPNQSCFMKAGFMKKNEYQEMLYDRRIHMKCIPEIRLEEGETLTVVVFNYAEDVKKTVNLKWSDYANSGMDVEQIEEEETLQQHTIFRADYARDDAKYLAWSSGSAAADIAEKKWAPPLRYYYTFWPDGQSFHQEPEYIGETDP